jgi:hypothetical protein
MYSNKLDTDLEMQHNLQRQIFLGLLGYQPSRSPSHIPSSDSHLSTPLRLSKSLKRARRQCSEGETMVSIYDHTQATEAQDEQLIGIWFDDPTIDPRDFTHICARFTNLYGHWPIVGRKVEGATR